MVICGNCGKEAPEGAFCIFCGAGLLAEVNDRDIPADEAPATEGFHGAQNLDADSESVEVEKATRGLEVAEPLIGVGETEEGKTAATEAILGADGSIDESSGEDAEEVIELEAKRGIDSENPKDEEPSLAPMMGEAPVLTTAPVAEPAGGSKGQDSSDSPKSEEAKKKNPYKVVLIVLGVLALLMVLVFVIAVATAETRTVIDVPAHKEKTGKYQVTMDDDDVCYVGQDWYDCIEDMANEYYGACANRTLATSANPRDVSIQQAKIVQSSTSLCSTYKNQIDRMRDIARPGDVVSQLGGYGHLTATETTITIPEESHEAVCYLGFIGECE